MKAKLILIALLALGSTAHAQGFASHISVGVGLEGIFPASTFNKEAEISNTGLPNTQSTTKSVGAVGDLRFDFGHHSAIDISVTVNRNSELFFNANSGAFDHVQTNNAEIIGSFILRLPSNDFVKPYALVGGGAVRFSPNNDFTTGGVPVVDTKAAFAYGFGADFPFGDHLALRLQYRGLVRQSPDFKLSAEPFGTGLKTHVPEPSVMLVWHF